MLIDLHTHTTASDGTLTPSELARAAGDRGIDLLAVTDHDTVAGCLEAAEHFPASSQFVYGIEFSAQWSGRGVHVVGLSLDLMCDGLQQAIDRQREARDRRAAMIANRLEKAGVGVSLDAVSARARHGVIGRPQFAAEMVAAGHVRDVKTAFRRYLGTGKIGDVKQAWPDLERVIDWVRQAGGIAVLAHPLKYRMTRTKLTSLVDEFGSAGGQAIEAHCGQQRVEDTRWIKALANDRGLTVSAGSDFHAPASWSRPGVPASLLDGARPVWDAW